MSEAGIVAVVGSVLVFAGTVVSTLYARGARREASDASRQLRPTNGVQTTQQVEAQGRLLEVVAGQVHDVSKRIDAQGRELSGIRRHNETIEAQLIAQGEGVDEVRRDLRTHLEEVAPLINDFIELKARLPKEDQP